MKDFLLSILYGLVILTLLFGAYAIVDYVYCMGKTADIGFPARWSLIGRCQIEVKPNQWIPLDNYYFKQE